jgi:hypothetical protein
LFCYTKYIHSLILNKLDFNIFVFGLIIYVTFPDLKGPSCVVVIVWQLNLQLPVQSVPINTKSCEFEPRSWWGVLDTTLCNQVCQWVVTGRWFSPGTPISSTNKTDCHNWNIVESGVKNQKPNLSSLNC